MSDTPDASRIPRMDPTKAREIARGLKCLAQSYAGAGMVRDAARAERDSHWWLAYAGSLAPPEAGQTNHGLEPPT
jgi:hypothetical protein